MPGRTIAVRLLILSITSTAVPQAASQPAGGSHGPQVELGGISGSLDQPRRHQRLRNAAELGPTKAQDIYQLVRPVLADGYARSGLSGIDGYQEWRQFNTVPYRSLTHGRLLLNNYANTAAADAYGRYEQGGDMPVGSIIAKDSFAITESGAILLGPLFVMEKMASGFLPLTRDWRFTEVLPDGTVLGETRGSGDHRVRYCIGCHLSAPRDLLYFLPTKFRQP